MAVIGRSRDHHTARTLHHLLTGCQFQDKRLEMAGGFHETPAYWQPAKALRTALRESASLFVQAHAQSEPAGHPREAEQAKAEPRARRRPALLPHASGGV